MNSSSGLLPPPRARRALQLIFGLILYGVSDGMLLLGGLGVDPWDVFHQGLSRRTGVAVGTWAIIVGAVVLLLWIPVRQRPGVGTLANVVVIGLQLAVMLGGVALNGARNSAAQGAVEKSLSAGSRAELTHHGPCPAILPLRSRLPAARASRHVPRPPLETH